MQPDEKFMRRCLDLALKGSGNVSPNPLVGAVLVYKDRIIGEGWHKEYGGAHAEVNCIDDVPEDKKHLISQSTLYVNLEPCAHFGKTPPCADFIVRNNIPRVIIGSADSNKEVAGKGIARLESAGITVITGILEKDCRLINRRFFTFQEQRRPYIIFKWAQSADGYIAPAGGQRTQLSNAGSMKLVHKMRKEEDAILIGFRTAQKDNPQLNNRLWNSDSNQPLRIVLDFENQLQPSLNIFDDRQSTIIFNYGRSEIKQSNQWVRIERDKDTVTQILQMVPGVQSIIIEGGARTLQLFIDADIWDEALIFKTNVFLQQGIPAPFLTNSRGSENFYLDNDIVSLQVHERNHFYL